MIVIGRDTLLPESIEDTAECVFGRFWERRPAGEDDWFYPTKTFVSQTVDGRRFEHDWIYHPDADAHEMLELTGRAQLTQGLERCRIARRGERKKPCNVLVFSIASLGYPVTNAVKYAAIESTIQTTMAGHGFQTESAKVLHALLPDQFSTIEAAKKALQRAHKEGRDKSKNLGTIALLNPTKKMSRVRETVTLPNVKHQIDQQQAKTNNGKRIAPSLVGAAIGLLS